MAVDYTKLCTNCGERRGLHYGGRCHSPDNYGRNSTFEPQKDTFHPHPASHALIDRSNEMMDRERGKVSQESISKAYKRITDSMETQEDDDRWEHQHTPDDLRINIQPYSIHYVDGIQKEGALNMCKDTGVISVCGDPKGKGCAYYVEATHEVRCMYLSHHEYCSCVDAQARKI